MGYRLTVYISVPEDEVKDFANALRNALHEMGYKNISNFVSDILLAVANAYRSQRDPGREIQEVLSQRQAQLTRRTKLISLIRGVIR